MLFTCEAMGVAAQDRGRTSVRWMHGQQNVEVVGGSGRVYVETDGPTVKKLYITALQARLHFTYRITIRK